MMRKAWRNMSDRSRELLCLLLMLGLGLIKQFLVTGLPIMAVPTGVHDDWIMVHMADSLRSGQWLGEYNSLTLTKGMFFPLYLAVINYFHLSYLQVTAALYTLACLCFVYALRPLLVRRRSRLILYAVLLWNPVSYSLQAYQRVYRNSISYIQVLFIFAGFLAMYLRRREPARRQIGWLIAAFCGTVSFFYTREDALWMEPFLAVFVIVYLSSIFGLWRQSKKEAEAVWDGRTELLSGGLNEGKNEEKSPEKSQGKNDGKSQGKHERWGYLAKAAMVLLPFLGIWLTGQGIAAMNEHYYGIRVVNELQSGGFSEMYKSMMAVKPEEEIDGVTMTQEKIARMCDACPTLKELEPYIQSSKEYWAGAEGDADTWEVRDGWVFWIFRTALEQAGYYSDGATANAICLQIRDELEAAMDAGTLERQATMPSTYMSPWRKGYLGDLIGALGDALAYTTTYDEMQTLVYLYSEPDQNGGIPLFERITGDKAVWYESDMVELSGWYASYDGMEGVTLQAEQQDGTVLGTVTAEDFTASADVEAYLAEQGVTCEGSTNCRFYLKVYQENTDQAVYVRTYRNGELLDEFLMTDDEGESLRYTTDSSELLLDWYWNVPERHGLLADINYKGVILNAILMVYRYIGPVVAIVSLICYLYICVRELQRAGKKLRGKKTGEGEVRESREKAAEEIWMTLKTNEKRSACWLITSALLASYLVLLGGISYSQISGWDAILYWYLSGAYPVLIAFEGLAVMLAVKYFRKRKKMVQD